ncbi:MAG: hypothetical protein CV087_13025 [Candidatus Brocadia sp. WS118]|nr:MAG: hypothetical protein CV087_13025 [Candidatus Brocadia sp. WS118]
MIVVPNFAVVSTHSSQVQVAAMRMRLASIDTTPIRAAAVVRAIKSYAAVNAVLKESFVVVRRAALQAISVEKACSVNVSS